MSPSYKNVTFSCGKARLGGGNGIHYEGKAASVSKKRARKRIKTFVATGIENLRFEGPIRRTKYINHEETEKHFKAKKILLYLSK